MATTSNGVFFPEHYGSGLMAKDIKAILKMLTIFTKLLAEYSDIAKKQYDDQYSDAKIAANSEKAYWNNEAASSYAQAAGALASAGVSAAFVGVSAKATAGSQAQLEEATTRERSLKPIDEQLQARQVAGRPNQMVGEGAAQQPEQANAPTQGRIDKIVSGGDVTNDATTRDACRVMNGDELISSRKAVSEKLEKASRDQLKASNIMQSTMTRINMWQHMATQGFNGATNAVVGFENTQKGINKAAAQTTQAQQQLDTAAAQTAAQEAQKQTEVWSSAIRAEQTIVQAQTAKV